MEKLERDGPQWKVYSDAQKKAILHGTIVLREMNDRVAFRRLGEHPRSFVGDMSYDLYGHFKNHLAPVCFVGGFIMTDNFLVKEIMPYRVMVMGTLPIRIYRQVTFHMGPGTAS